MTGYYLVNRQTTMATQIKKDQRMYWAGLPQASFPRSLAAFLARAVLLGAVALNTLLLPAVAAPNSPPLSTLDPAAGSRDNASASAPAESQVASVELVRLANFGQEVASPESRKLADWVVDSADNGKLPFMIIDKVQARVFMFNAQGQLRGAASALLGLAVGDHTVPGIGQRKLSSILPAERTTPAGRFVASLDRDIHGQEVLWVDYDSALSLHRVVTGQPKERRAERLATPSPLDNRISFGCINVPVKFYENVVSPSFTGTNGIVYILPETRSAREVFGSYDVQDSSRKQASARVAPVGESSTR
ncbi:hypothetical protein [Polaromonas sp.]|uniref:hypothetical protein n=1 Tax=Polaromonas sp. TaxID=1869339 RepID=UPI00272CE239|nr:hypothetical protein [Polaromonas sp.]MDP1885205.1 hypothetical protein [Polaromonas sp.]